MPFCSQKLLGQVTIDGGGFTTDALSERGLLDLFDDVVPPASSAPAVSNSSSARVVNVENTLLQAEDEDDRIAALRAKQECQEELVEFDETKPYLDDSVPSTGGPASTDQDAVVEDQSTHALLQSQLSQLRGVERHAMQVLESYMTPVHLERLAQARENLKARNEELRAIEQNMVAARREMASDDEEEVFYDKTEAFEAYMAAALPPPVAFNPDLTALYIDPVHAAQYRVAYMTFEPTPMQFPVFSNLYERLFSKFVSAAKKKALAKVALQPMLVANAVPDARVDPEAASKPITLARSAPISIFRRKQGLHFGREGCHTVACQRGQALAGCCQCTAIQSQPDFGDL